MTTLETAKYALTKATAARFHEMNGIVEIAIDTTDHLLMIECVRRLNAHIKAVVENTAVLYGETILEASEDLVKTYEDKLDERLNAAGYTPESIEKILQLD